jgi:negative regulator of replication initiation
MKKIEVDKDLLYHYYIEENLSIGETAEKMKIGSRTIQRAIKANRI